RPRQASLLALTLTKGVAWYRLLHLHKCRDSSGLSGSRLDSTKIPLGGVARCQHESIPPQILREVPGVDSGLVFAMFKTSKPRCRGKTKAPRCNNTEPVRLTSSIALIEDRSRQ